MTRRQLAKIAFDDQHLRLMLAVRTAAPGQKQRAKDAVTAYVTACLAEAAAALKAAGRRR